MRKVNLEQLIDIVIKRFESPISLLEVIGNETQLINGLPLTYLLRYITKKAEAVEGYNGEFEIEEINNNILKIKFKEEIIVMEQDTEDNVLNFDIG